MSSNRALRLHAVAAAVAGTLTLLAGCDQPGPQMRADTFPMGVADKFNQPPPQQPLFGSDEYWRGKDVMPVAKADTGEVLPPSVPLPAALAAIDVLEPQAPSTQPGQAQGGVTPAAGMAAVVTSAQGDGESNQLDGTEAK